MSESSLPRQPIAVKPAAAAELMDCTRGHIYDLIARGVLRRLQIEGSRSVRIPLTDIYAALGLDMPQDPAA